MSKQRRNWTAAMAGLVVCAGAAAGSDAIFDNITAEAGGFLPVTPFDPTLAIVDDLIVDGGGELQDLTFTYSYAGAGFGIPTVAGLDVEVVLALDNGDGVFNPIDESPLFIGSVTNLSAELNVVKTHTLALPGGIQVADGSTIWFATTYAPQVTNFLNWGQALYNDRTLGSSDANVYTYDFATNALSTSSYSAGEGLGAVLTVTPAPASVLALAPLGLALRRRR